MSFKNSITKTLSYILIVVMFLALHTEVLAYGYDLDNIKIKDLKETTQIILDFSSMPQNYVLDKSAPNQVNILMLDTFLSPNLIKNLDIILNDNIKWEQLSNRLSVSFKHRGLSKYAKINKSSNPKQLIINIPKTEIATKPLPRHAPVSRSISKPRNQLTKFVANVKSKPSNKVNLVEIYPGVKHIKIQKNTEQGPLFINVLDITPNNSYINVTPALANDKIYGKKTIKTIIKENNAIAGINAGFFKPPTGHPLGTIIIDDELISGPIFDRVTFGITRDNRYKIERIHLTGKLTTPKGETLILDNVNQPRLNADQYLLYSYRWHWNSPKSPVGSKHILLQNGMITNISAESLPIPRNGYVIVGPDKGLFSKFNVGDRLSLVVCTDPDWSDVKHAIGGGPFLVKNGGVYVDKADQKFRLKNVPEPRTAIGVTKENHLLLVTVDGRQKNSSIGMTFYQLANLMIELGSYHAMNLDGGSSTQMCIKDSVVNMPTVSGGSSVSNGIILVPKNESPLVSYR